MKIPLKTKLTISVSYGLALGCGMVIANLFPGASSNLGIMVCSILFWIFFEIVDEIDARKNAFVTRTLWHKDGRKIVLILPDMSDKTEIERTAVILSQLRGQI